jgi:predicted RNA-binding protein
MSKYWIGVASREHVKRGEKEGIAQLCHGKGSPLKRMKPGDWIIYYSPAQFFSQEEPCRKFTAIGQIKDKEPYQFTMSDDFIHWRRDVAFISCQEVAIHQLLDKLSFIKNKSKWGYVFRFGMIEIPQEDFQIIARSMGLKRDK